jgi:hypothetical protein
LDRKHRSDIEGGLVRFWKRRGGLDLEAELRAARPEPRRELLHTLTERVREDGRAPLRRRAPRLALAGALTAAMLAALASVGGFGYAATAARQAVLVAKSILVSSGSDAVVVRGLSAGGDQYQPGFEWGDPDHNHTGSPGLQVKGGALAPPLIAQCGSGGGAHTLVKTTIVLDEQADLRISVLGPDGKKLLLTQKGSRVGGALTGKQTKTIKYRVLVPRAIQIRLRIPCSVLQAGESYRIQITATDPDGNTSKLTAPFRVQSSSA